MSTRLELPGLIRLVLLAVLGVGVLTSCATLTDRSPWFSKPDTSAVQRAADWRECQTGGNAAVDFFLGHALTEGITHERECMRAKGYTYAPSGGGR